jgi:5-methylcytosine-specific restriction endonuclease McrA
MKCRNVWQSGRMRGDGNNNWRDGISKSRYFPGSQPQFRLARDLAMKMDGGKCVVCNSAHNLHGHHINGNPADNRVENLATLCKRCHYVYHGAEREKPPRQLWPWLSEYAVKRQCMT